MPSLSWDKLKYEGEKEEKEEKEEEEEEGGGRRRGLHKWRLQRAVDGSLGTAHDKIASVPG